MSKLRQRDLLSLSLLHFKHLLDLVLHLFEVYSYKNINIKITKLLTFSQNQTITRIIQLQLLLVNQVKKLIISQQQKYSNHIQLKIMKSSHSIQPFVANKKLIIHFDVDNVLRINHANRDLFVYELCARWVWGKLQKTSKQDPDKVTGWKLAVNTLSVQQPQVDLLTYNEYLDQYLKPSAQERQKLLLNLSKGPAAKAKAQIEKNIKNITLPKTLYDTLKQTKENENYSLKRLLEKYSASGKYQILPAFYKYVMWLKKSKREFALIIKNNNPSDSHKDIINQLNLFFTGEHPLFNGKNGTPQVKFDGSKGCKNFVVDDQHQTVVYEYSEKEIFSSFGTVQNHKEKDLELFKQHFKSLKQIKLCQGASNIYAYSHTLLASSACIYEVNPTNSLFIDPVDYLTHEIYFTGSNDAKVISCLGQTVNSTDSMVVHIKMFDFLKDVDYFVKHTEELEKRRADEIQRIEKGDGQHGHDNEVERVQENEPKQSDGEYLKRTILPVLQGALKQVTLLRPQDPIGYLALLCLKNKDKIKASK